MVTTGVYIVRTQLGLQSGKLIRTIYRPRGSWKTMQKIPGICPEFIAQYWTGTLHSLFLWWLLTAVGVSKSFKNSTHIITVVTVLFVNYQYYVYALLQQNLSNIIQADTYKQIPFLREFMASMKMALTKLSYTLSKIILKIPNQITVYYQHFFVENERHFPLWTTFLYQKNFQNKKLPTYPCIQFPLQRSYFFYDVHKAPISIQSGLYCVFFCERSCFTHDLYFLWGSLFWNPYRRISCSKLSGD